MVGSPGWARTSDFLINRRGPVMSQSAVFSSGYAQPIDFGGLRRCRRRGQTRTHFAQGDGTRSSRASCPAQISASGAIPGET